MSARRKAGGQAAVHAHAVRAVVQMLIATGRAYSLETLRGKLREFFLEENDYEKRAVASLGAVELITALLEASPALEALGLSLVISNGTARLMTARVANEKLAAFLAAQAPGGGGAGELSAAALEVLACVAFKQPLSQAEIDRLFGGVDKRHVVSVLRQAGLVEEFAGADGRLRFATTAFWSASACGAWKSWSTPGKGRGGLMGQMDKMCVFYYKKRRLFIIFSCLPSYRKLMLAKPSFCLTVAFCLSTVVLLGALAGSDHAAVDSGEAAAPPLPPEIVAAEADYEIRQQAIEADLHRLHLQTLLVDPGERRARLLAWPEQNRALLEAQAARSEALDALYEQHRMPLPPTPLEELAALAPPNSHGSGLAGRPLLGAGL